ncbi:MAG: hypothetical protein HQ530_04295 [Parcubacteria group bacterium]|nr:hypothetical protein [Parcubacteria group bacterium]
MATDQEGPMEEIAAKEAQEDPRLKGAVEEWKSWRKTRSNDKMEAFKSGDNDRMGVRFAEEKDKDRDIREHSSFRNMELRRALRDDNHEYAEVILDYCAEHCPDEEVDLKETMRGAIYLKLFEEVNLKHDPYNNEACPVPLDEGNFDSLDKFAEGKDIKIDWQDALQDILTTNGLGHAEYHTRAELLGTKKASGQPDMVERIQQLAQKKGVEIVTNTPETRQKFEEDLNRDIERQIQDTMQVILNSQEGSRGFTGAEYLKSLTGSHAKMNEKYQVGADFKDALERQTAFCHSLIETLEQDQHAGELSGKKPDLKKALVDMYVVLTEAAREME